MAFKINTNISKNKNYGTVATEEIREVSVFYFDKNDSITVRIKLKDGSELCVSSDGEKRVIEWDSVKRVAKVENVNSDIMANMVVKI